MDFFYYYYYIYWVQIYRYPACSHSPWLISHLYRLHVWTLVAVGQKPLTPGIGLCNFGDEMEGGCSMRQLLLACLSCDFITEVSTSSFQTLSLFVRRSFISLYVEFLPPGITVFLWELYWDITHIPYNSTI